MCLKTDKLCELSPTPDIINLTPVLFAGLILLFAEML